MIKKHKLIEVRKSILETQKKYVEKLEQENQNPKTEIRF